MSICSLPGEQPEQGRVVDRQHLARWRLDIQRQAGRIGGKSD
jgi:hypothetical protein